VCIQICLHLIIYALCEVLQSTISLSQNKFKLHENAMKQKPNMPSSGMRNYILLANNPNQISSTAINRRKITESSLTSKQCNVICLSLATVFTSIAMWHHPILLFSSDVTKAQQIRNYVVPADYVQDQNKEHTTHQCFPCGAVETE
jgi:hypothetical protein